MAILLSEEQEELKKLVEDFMKKEYLPHRKEIDETGEFPVEIYKKAFDLGLHMLAIPEEHGGSGLDNQTVGVILESIAYYDAGFAITLLVTALALECVLVGGNPEQIKYVSELLINGGFGSFCLTEPDSGSDAVSVRCKYSKEGDEYIINGSKCFVTTGEYADVYIVFATKDPSLGSKGISAFIVERTRPGIVIGAHEDKMGLRSSNTTTVNFDKVRIPAKNLISEEGKGFYIAMAGLDQGRLNNACVSVGLAKSALDEAVKYSKERLTFGKPIIKHQAIQMMLADMAMYTEAAKSLARNGMVQLDAGLNTTMIASMAKAFCSDVAMKVTTDAVQVLGGYGYSKEYPVEKLMRDAKIFQIFEGTNQIQRMVIARQLEKQ